MIGGGAEQHRDLCPAEIASDVVVDKATLFEAINKASIPTQSRKVVS